MKLKKVRLAWAQYLFEPEDFNGDVKYKINVIIPKNHPQLGQLARAIVKAIQKKFTSAEGLTSPLVDCDKTLASADHPCLRNCYTLLLKAGLDKKPVVTDRAGRMITQDDGIIYPGCYVDVDVSFTAYNFEKKVLGRYMNSVQFAEDGPRIDDEAANSPYMKGFVRSVPLPKPTPSEEERVWKELNKAEEWDDAKDEEQFWKNMKKAEASNDEWEDPKDEEQFWKNMKKAEASNDDGEADIPF